MSELDAAECTPERSTIPGTGQEWKKKRFSPGPSAHCGFACLRCRNVTRVGKFLLSWLFFAQLLESQAEDIRVCVLQTPWGEWTLSNNTLHLTNGRACLSWWIFGQVYVSWSCTGLLFSKRFRAKHFAFWLNCALSLYLTEGIRPNSVIVLSTWNWKHHVIVRSWKSNKNHWQLRVLNPYYLRLSWEAFTWEPSRFYCYLQISIKSRLRAINACQGDQFWMDGWIDR